MKKINTKYIYLLFTLVIFILSGCNSKNGERSYKKLFGDYDFSSVQYSPYDYSSESNTEAPEEIKETEDEKLCKDYSLYEKFGEFIYVKASDHICIADYIPKESNHNHEATNTVIFPDYIDNLPVTYISSKGFRWLPMHSTHHIEKMYIPKTITSIQDGFFACLSEYRPYIDCLEIDPENPVLELEIQVCESDEESEGLQYSGIYDKIQKKLVAVVPNAYPDDSYYEKCFWVKEGTEIIGRNSINTSCLLEFIIPDSVTRVEFNYFEDYDGKVQVIGGKNAEFFPEYYEDSNVYKYEEDNETQNDPDFVDDYKWRGYAVLPDPTYNPIPDSFVVNGIVISNKLGYENGYIFNKEKGEFLRLLEAPEDGILTLSENIKYFDTDIYEIYYDKTNNKYYKDIELKKVILPDTIDHMWEACYNNVLSFEVSPNNKNFIYKDGFLIDKNNMKLCAIDGTYNTKDYFIIPDGIKEISDILFSEYGFRDVTIFLPDSLSSIPQDIYNIVFYGRPDSKADKAGRGLNYCNWYNYEKIGAENRAVYRVKENLRMRKTSDLNSEIECVLNNGSILYQLDKNEEEIEIDGMSGCWLKVVCYKDAFDKDGNQITPGTCGWVFDSYLERLPD